MRLTFYLDYREGKQYMCVLENNTGKEHEIFLGFVEQTQLPEKLIGILEIPKNIPEKEKMIELIGKILISIKLVSISQLTEIFEEEVENLDEKEGKKQEMDAKSWEEWVSVMEENLGICSDDKPILDKAN